MQAASLIAVSMVTFPKPFILFNESATKHGISSPVDYLWFVSALHVDRVT
jgi:hypothetical protein